MQHELFLQSLRHAPLIAILRGAVPAEVIELGQALVDSGIRVIEVPLNSPEPLESIARLSQHFPSGCLLGAGTVTRVAEVIGAAVLGALRQVLPPATLMFPVGGITPENMSVYAKAGANGFGLGSALYRRGQSPEETAAKATGFVRAWRSLAKSID